MRPIEGLKESGDQPFLMTTKFMNVRKFKMEGDPTSFVAPDFKAKTRYTRYVSPGSQISHMATNKGNINRQYLMYNILCIKDITLDNKQRKDNFDLRVKTLIPQGQLTG